MVSNGCLESVEMIDERKGYKERSDGCIYINSHVLGSKMITLHSTQMSLPYPPVTLTICPPVH